MLELSQPVASSITTPAGRVEIVFFSWGLGGAWPRGGSGLRLERLFKPVE